MHTHTYTHIRERCIARLLSMHGDGAFVRGVREFKDVVFEDVVFDNDRFDIDVEIQTTIYNRVTQLLLSDTTSSNTASLNSRGV